MASSNYPDGWANGVTIRGVPLLQCQPGQVLWVGNGSTILPGCTAGSDGNPGTYQRPLATLANAVSRCFANTGDIIVVKPQHAESITAAAGLVLSVAGVAIVGLGAGTNRPTITMSTASTASITVTASNIAVQNLLFTSTIAALATVFDNANAVVANDFAIDMCEFRDSSTTLNIVRCFRSGTTANQADGFQFTRNKVLSIMGTPTAGTTCVQSQAAQARFKLADNVVVRTAALNNTAVLLAMGANNHTLMEIARNRTNSPNTGTTAGELFSGGSTGSTGHVYDNYSWHLASTGLLAPVSTGLAFSQNYCSITGAADKQPLANPLLV